MKNWLVAVALGLGVVPAGTTMACEPCAERWDLARTAKEADLVVVAQKVKEGPSTARGPVLGRQRPPGGPDWIEVRVLQVLKGSTPGSQARANGWDGMCAFGFIVDDRPQVLFLMQPASGSEYQAPNFGCSVTSLPLEKGRLLVGDQSVSLAAFAAWLRVPDRPLIAPPDSAIE